MPCSSLAFHGALALQKARTRGSVRIAPSPDDSTGTPAAPPPSVEGRHGSNASSVLFGYEFQAYAAIILCVRHINTMKSVRLEGAHEDIEIAFDSGDMLYAQAKSSVTPQGDRNASSKARKALETLAQALVASRGPGAQDCVKLVYASNLEKPFGSRLSLGDDHKLEGTTTSFSRLPNAVQEFIRKHLPPKSTSHGFEDRFELFTLRFEGDGDKRYEQVDKIITSFLANLLPDSDIDIGELRTTWWHIIYSNGSQNDLRVEVSKRELISPIVACACKSRIPPPDLLDDLDQRAHLSAVRRFDRAIDRKAFDFSIGTRVVSDFDAFCLDAGLDTASEPSIVAFIRQRWTAYTSILNPEGADDHENQALVYETLYRILYARHAIAHIKEQTGCLPC